MNGQKTLLSSVNNSEESYLPCFRWSIPTTVNTREIGELILEDVMPWIGRWNEVRGPCLVERACGLKT